MRSRIRETFERLGAERRAGLVTYVTAGDPDLERSARVLGALDGAGADILEIGVPFSDPLADGPVIQRASERALASGTTLAATLEMVARERAAIRAPIVLFTYANPVVRVGLDRFAARASEAGVDGVLVLDLPVEEAGGLRAALEGVGLDTIFLLSPTTTPARIREAGRLGRGFLYAISRLGVTGARASLADGARDLVARIKRETALPVAVGFGLSTPEHVADVAQWADAAVVGSALVDVIGRWGQSDALVEHVEAFVRALRRGCAPRPLGGEQDGPR
ncbi:MAG: trpA [Acidobacteria bacterium]|nr:trpA [Acidobacteriota bacterium]